MTVISRRHFLALAGLLPLLGRAQVSGRVLIVGGGWGGLAVALALRQQAPELAVTLIDRQAAFSSFALSNRWLVDFATPMQDRHDYADIARRHGYRFVQADVQEIDRAQRTVRTSAGQEAYDWLVLAPGIRELWAAWGVSDPAAVADMQQRFGGAMAHPAALSGLKRRLAGFTGGDLLMSIPPAPYRCPPAPYERALYLADWLKRSKIAGKLIIADPNPIMPAFRNALQDRYRDQVTYLDHAVIRRIDPARQTVSTDIDDIRFDAALLAPPQQAADLLWSAGLIRPASGSGQPSGWAAQGVLDFRSPYDARVFIIGDATGAVSPAFGYYPKTGQIAVRMGQAVARQIAAEASGRPAEAVLPESICHVTTSLNPPEAIRIETHYRDRGDGFLIQQVQQLRNPQPAGEDEAWAAAMAGELGLRSG